MIDQTKIAAARAAQKRIWKAKHEYTKALAAAYPVGQRTYYRLGDRWVSCEVVGHGTEDLIVRGDNSGKEYRISGYRFHE